MKFKFSDNKLYVEDEEGCVAVNEHYLTKEDIGLSYTSNLLEQLLKQKCESKFLLISTFEALIYRIQQYNTAVQTHQCLADIDKVQRGLSWICF
ncbi:MAG: hypothetical protein MJZ34_14490 [Paludibacteraceae bacterium]|nr:hypothetical protein [Paludibacteraceae bacterium]